MAVAALIEPDGVARRLVLYPPDLSLAHLPFVARSEAVDAIVSHRATIGIEIRGGTSFVHCDERIVPPVSLRPYVQLPADVSQRRRPVGARCHSGGWRCARNSRKILRQPVLE
jgi:hypothetical protein